MFVVLAAGLFAAGARAADETIMVPGGVGGGPMETSSTVLVASHKYEVTATGTVSYWCQSSDPSSCFWPAYMHPSLETAGVDALYCYATWRCPTPQLWRPLQVNGMGLDQLAGEDGTIRYNGSHAYTVTVTGVSGALSLQDVAPTVLSSLQVTIHDLSQGGTPPPGRTPTFPPLPARFKPSVIAHFGPRLAAHAREILRSYYQLIPSSLVRYAYDHGAVRRNFWTRQLAKVLPLGALNNIAFGSNNFACGGYQGQVLSFLDALRNDPDPTKRALLNGLDYGPVEVWYVPGTPFGGHQAVVLYPHGEDFRTQGVVLDPWIDQQPNVYLMQDWLGEVGWGGLEARPTEVYAGQYPLTGGSYYPPSLTAPRPNVARNPQPTRRLAVESPVVVLLHDGHGGVIGLDSSGHVRDSSHLWIDATAFRTRTGYETSMMFPPGHQTVSMHAIGNGPVHVFSASGARSVWVYKTVRVRRGAQLTLTWPTSAAVPVLTDSGKRIPSSPVAVPAY